MQSELECLICLLNQALNTVILATEDINLQREVINRTADWIRQADLVQTPAAISTEVYRIVSELTGVDDPYKEIKEQTNQEALHMLPDLKKMINESADQLDTALHLAVAGNIIDLGIGHNFDLKKDVISILKIPFAIRSVHDFKKELYPGQKLLYLGDNSGEIVFDRLLIELILDHGVDVTFVVKSGPIINDALMQDAVTTGLTDIVPVIESGSDDIGINFKRASKEFINTFITSDFILAKGHGNFGSCDERSENLYFLLKAKCPVVARKLGVKTGDIVFKH